MLAEIRTESIVDEGGPHHWAKVYVQGREKQPVSAVLTGPGVSTPWDLPVSGKTFAGTVNLGATPQVSSYSLQLTYSDGSEETFTLNPTYLTSYAEPVAPQSLSRPLPPSAGCLPLQRPRPEPPNVW